MVKVVGSRPAFGFESQKLETVTSLENYGHFHQTLLLRSHFGWVCIWDMVFLYVDGIVLLPKILEIFFSMLEHVFHFLLEYIWY